MVHYDPGSRIQEIRLPQAVFLPSSFLPAKINLILGRNGTGKTTFAQTLRDPDAFALSGEQTYAIPRISIFDRHYVEETLRQYEKLPGIVTFSKHNAAVEKRIAEAKSSLAFHRAQLADLMLRSSQMEQEQAKAFDAFQEACWKETKELRKQFEKALGGKKNKAETCGGDPGFGIPFCTAG